MTPYKFSGIAHSSHRYWSPLGQTRLDTLASLIPLKDDSRIVDFGCGNGAMLAALANTFGCSGVGLDRSPYAIEAARKIKSENVEFRQQDASELSQGKSFDLALCVGATGIFGGLEGALKALPKFVEPGGYVLIGEGFWRQEPSPEYLALLGATPDEMMSHADTARAVRESGLRLLCTCAANDDEWDEYEGRYLGNVETYCRENPSDPEAPEMLEKIRKWHDGYLRWGRDTLGFGYYLACLD